MRGFVNFGSACRCGWFWCCGFATCSCWFGLVIVCGWAQCVVCCGLGVVFCAGWFLGLRWVIMAQGFWFWVLWFCGGFGDGFVGWV